MERNPIRKSLVVVALTLGTLLSYHGASASSSTSSSQLHFGEDQGEGDRSKEEMLKILVPALLKAGKAGRVYYEAFCPDDSEHMTHFIFPQIKVHQPSGSASGLAAIQEIFHGDTNVEIGESPPGIIRIRIGNISDDLLKTNIPLHRFVPNGEYDSTKEFWSHRQGQIDMGPPGEYDPRSAIDEINRNDAVLAAEKKLNLREGNGFIDHGVNPPMAGKPYLSDPVVNKSLDQALDLVAQTFHGIVMFASCSNGHKYADYFDGGPQSIWARP